MSRIKIITVTSGILSILLGSPYIFGMYGPTEREVAMWGVVEAIAGIIIVFIAGFLSQNKLIKVLAVALWSFNILMQILPSLLWFTFNGSGISDGSPPSDFVASWVYALPHISIGLISILGIYLLCRKSNELL